MRGGRWMDAKRELTLAEAVQLTGPMGRPLKLRALQAWCSGGRMRCRKIGTGRRAIYLVTELALREALATVPRRGGNRRQTRRTEQGDNHGSQ